MLAGKSQKELLKLSRNVMQPLLPNYYKGQSGKIAVIGGCEDYTGAPFFACHSAALVGSDLSHVVCEKRAGGVIKGYSPDLMVHPYLYEIDNEEVQGLKKSSLAEVIKKDFKDYDGFIDHKIMPKVLAIINRSDMFVIGPGMGRDCLMMKTIIKIIEQIKVVNKPMIIDADGLYLLSLDPSIIKNYSKAILTPNLIEFDRIGTKLGLESILTVQDLDKQLQVTQQVSKALGVTVVRKNSVELIVDQDQYVINDTKGSNRRVGGQGDTLTGCLATFVTWSYHYQQDYWDVPSPKLTSQESILLGCFAASLLVRVATNRAYKKYGRALQTSNVHECLGEAYTELFDNDDFIKL